MPKHSRQIMSAFDQQIAAIRQRFQMELGVSGPVADACQALLEELQTQNEELNAATQDLEAERERYHDLFEFAPEGYCETDPLGVIRVANQAAGTLLGMASADLVGTPLPLYVPEAERGTLRTHLAHPPVDGSWAGTLLRRQDTPFPAVITLAAIADPVSRKLAGYRCLLRDVSAQRQAEALLHQAHQDLEGRVAERTAALQDSEARFKALATATFEGIALTEAGRYVDANEQFVTLLGYTREELLGREVVANIPAEDQERVLANIRADRESTVEHTVVRKDGTRLVVEAHGRTVEYQHRKVRVTAIRDITARTQAEEALRQAQATLERRVQERTADLAQAIRGLEQEVAERQRVQTHLQRTNRVLRLLSACNEALVRIDDESALTSEICRIVVEIGEYRMAWVGAADGDPARRVRPVATHGIEAGYLERANITWADMPHGQGPTGTAIRTGAIQIGHDFLTESRLAPWRAEALARGFRSSIALPLREGTHPFGALTIYAAEPEAFQEAEVAVLRDLAENLAFGIGAARVRRALRASRDQQQALAGELAVAEQRERQRLSEVLHDGLQQLLVGARMQVELLARIDADPARLTDRCNTVHSLLTEALLASRTLTAELSPPILRQAGLLPALQWLARWMQDTHHLSVELTTQASAEPAEEAMRILLFQAVRELLFNTVKHAGVQQATIDVTHQNGHLHIRVADQGAGFDPEHMTRSGPGGLGLATIRQRLAFLGGSLNIESAPGKGSRFTLGVPLQAARPDQAVAPPERGALPHFPVMPGGRTLRLLMADDHAVMRQSLARVLAEEADLEVVGEAADGKQAVELAGQLQPDLVLMDLSMPVMDGIEATQTIRAAYPHIQVIGLSMFADPEQEQRMRAAGAVDYVAKSSATEVLLAAIRACAARAAGSR